jgi:hypothetical protein
MGSKLVSSRTYSLTRLIQFLLTVRFIPVRKQQDGSYVFDLLSWRYKKFKK